MRQVGSVEDVQARVSALKLVKALGSRHSFNGIADTTGEQLLLDSLDGMELDVEARSVRVGAGVRYGRLAPWLDAQGFAVHNLASLPHISVVGACATATHGSGLRNGSLSSAVSAIEFVDGTDRVRRLSRDERPDEFAGAVVSLGALGVVTSMTLDVVPSFEISQTVYEDLPFAALETAFDEIFGSGYSVSLFTDWQGNRATQAWVKRLAHSSRGAQDTFFGATRQTRALHPLPGLGAENCTEQMGVPGPWYERLPHFRMDFIPSSGAELQSEYFVARDNAVAALRAIETLRDEITPRLLVSEIRTVAADELWMSMAYRRDSVGFHFTWKPETEAVMALLPRIEARLEQFAARPHWAKLHTIGQERLAARYPKFEAFRALMHQRDPDRRFRNAYLTACFGE
jgi:xylitol oxidase